MSKIRILKRDAKAPVAFQFVNPITEHDINAIKDLAKGQASEHQQLVALKCIMNTISGAYDVSFVPGSSDQTGFREGRAFVGKTINRFILADINTLLGALPE